MIARFYIAELLLISLFRISSSQDAACDSAYSTASGEAFFGEKCVEGSDASCPQACEDMFIDLHETCAGKTYTTTVDEENVVTSYSPDGLLGFWLVLDEGCENSPVTALLSRDDLTCKEWLGISGSAAIFYCDEECSSLCRSLIDKVYASCSATTEIVDGDGDISTAEEIETGENAIYRSSDCNTYAATLKWGGGVGTLSDTPQQPDESVTTEPTATPSVAPQVTTAVSLPENTSAPTTQQSIDASPTVKSPVVPQTAEPQQSVSVTTEPTASLPTAASPVVLPTSSPVVASTADTARIGESSAASRGWFLLWATLASSVFVSTMW